MTEREDSKLLKKRASYKGQLTAFSNYLDGLNVSLMRSADISELRLRLSKVNLLYDKYDEVQLALECDCDEPSSLLGDREKFESYYYRTLARAQDLIRDYEKLINLDNSSDKCSHSSNVPVRLPTIQLPKFSGSYDNWLEFHDTFMSLIHQNNDIDTINKFHYLRASLEGSAAVVIQSVGFSANNYEVAWNLLCDRFDNKSVLIHNHVSALFNIEPITRESSITLKRLIDHINKNLRALETLGEPIKHWDTLLIYIFTHKLDSKTYRDWEECKGSLSKDQSLTFEFFMTFLRRHADLIETLEMSRTTNHNLSQTSKHSSKLKTLVAVQPVDNISHNTYSKLCPKCNGQHHLNNCSQFLALSNEERLGLLPKYKLCFNCFRSGHFANSCKKPGCKICKRKHHTLIHIAEFKSRNAINETTSTGDCHREPSTRAPAPPVPGCMSGEVTLSASVATTSKTHNDNEVLLSTALITLYDFQQREHIARAILDSGSTSCIMSQQMYEKLNLPYQNIYKSILGINNSLTEVNKMCNVQAKSLNEQFSTNFQCLILPTITDKVPSHEINISLLSLPSNISLADPCFYSPSHIDLILGADVFWDVLGSQKLSLGKGQPVLYETKLGWLVSGPINSNFKSAPPNDIRCNFTRFNCRTHTDDDDTQTQLMRFWQLEEVGLQSSHYSQEEKSCEDHFIKNTIRLENGRFCVKIPLKESHLLLGDSFERAKGCFLSLERKLDKQPLLKQMYQEFMTEYEDFGHMTEINMSDSSDNAYYIPHHGILKESSTTTKLRAVFNASSPTTTGVSLNNIQMVGPIVQDDLLSILLRFRQYKFVLTADVEKMYRQVSVHPDCRYLQQIIWRKVSTDTLKIYKLNTVTYGTASAPFLATRCLHQIGLECKDAKISNIIKHDFYVDDLLTGGDSIDEVLNIREQVTKELAAACMPLRKWKSNSHHIIGESTQSPIDLNRGSTEPNKTLGLGWEIDSDCLCFPTSSSVPQRYTKRDILSVIAQIFDPLGLLGPCVITMKILLQTLWLRKLSWDDELTSDIIKIWADIVKNIPTLNNIKIQRHVICNSYKIIELHIFTDASERAYGACAYVRSLNDKGEVLTRLLMAKSRVAPIKPTTIPRLELCAALTGSRLYDKIISSLRCQFNSVTFWTDSTIVLGWLKMLPIRLHPFVRNRVADILERTSAHTWRHVPTNHNPADLISRGVDIDLLESLNLWWSGPVFLQSDISDWPTNPGVTNNLPETRQETTFHLMLDPVDSNSPIIDFERFSSLLRLNRSFAYVLKFIHACKNKAKVNSSITREELDMSLTSLIKLSQSQSFPEYQLLLTKKELPKKSNLIKLNVFLDQNNIMRVGGRLANSNLPYAQKHPMLLQSTHHFTKLVFRCEHIKLMHAGPQLLLASIRETYWPIGGRSLARACFRECIRCKRFRGQVATPLMGNLPRERVSPSYPFQNVGVDYAGPIMSASRQGRGCRLMKVYIVIFVCFATKAIHLELVSDLTSGNFLSALRRFMSRRGKPTNLFSDNGTSFVGTYNELSQFLINNNKTLLETAANDGINFHFIPAYAPHFGGLWEAGVKSTKFHLKRVLGNCNLTFEELYTTLSQIEAILNSRPLTPLSTNPEDLTPLTPGHFLIGRPLTSLPSQDITNHSSTYLTRFQRIEQLRQHFWARWSKEYVSELQQRVKWYARKDPLKINSLILLKEDNLPPLKWRLGRIIALYPGSDGISRVADVKTSTGVVRRSFSKMCPLLEADDSVERDAFNARGHV